MQDSLSASFFKLMRECTIMKTAVASTIRQTASPNAVFIILRNPTSVLNRDVIAFSRLNTDISAPAKFSAFEAESTGLFSLRNFTRFTIERVSM